MCFSTPKVKAATPIAAAPTTVSTGADEAVQEAKDKDKKRQRAASGFQQNILTGSTGVSDTGVAKKQLLGQ